MRTAGVMCVLVAAACTGGAQGGASNGQILAKMEEVEALMVNMEAKINNLYGRSDSPTASPTASPTGAPTAFDHDWKLDQAYCATMANDRGACRRARKICRWDDNTCTPREERPISMEEWLAAEEVCNLITRPRDCREDCKWRKNICKTKLDYPDHLEDNEGGDDDDDDDDNGDDDDDDLNRR